MESRRPVCAEAQTIGAKVGLLLGVGLIAERTADTLSAASSALRADGEYMDFKEAAPDDAPDLLSLARQAE